jgi:hypothetical protein
MDPRGKIECGPIASFFNSPANLMDDPMPCLAELPPMCISPEDADYKAAGLHQISRNVALLEPASAPAKSPLSTLKGLLGEFNEHIRTKPGLPNDTIARIVFLCTTTGLDERSWECLTSSPFFRVLSKGFNCEDFSQMGLCSVITSIFDAAIRAAPHREITIGLTQTGAYAAMLHYYPGYYARVYEADNVPCWMVRYAARILATLFRFFDHHAAAIFEYADSISGTSLLGAALRSGGLTAFAQSQPTGDPLPWNDIMLMPHIWLAFQFISSQFSPPERLDDLDDSDRAKCSIAVLSAFFLVDDVRLSDLFPDECMALLMPISSIRMARWLSQAWVADTEAGDIVAALNLLLAMLGGPWKEESDETHRGVLDVLADQCIWAIQEHDGIPFQETALRFFVFFLDRRLYTEGDRSDMQFLQEVEITDETCAAHHARLMTYWSGD